MMQNSVEGLNWWHYDQPTLEELRLSGGLQVEDWPHARHVMYLSVQIFKATQPLHRLHGRDLFLLERAALLHNSGMLIDTRRHHKHSFRLIKEAALPDVTDKEQHEIACIARYHRRALPSKDHEEFAALTPPGRRRVSKLAALLRIADALDFNHDGRVLHLAANQAYCSRSVWTISLWTRPLAELDEELQHAQDKADLFEKVFHHKFHLSVQEE